MFDEIRSGVAKLQKEQDEFKRDFGKKSTEGDASDATSGSKENVRGAVNFAASLKKVVWSMHVLCSIPWY